MSLKRTIGLSLVVLLLAGLTVYGVYYNREAQRYEAALVQQYDRAFSDLIGYLEETEYSLLKSLATGTHEKTAALLEEAGRSAAQAESCLQLLPLHPGLVDRVSRYLVQLGDVSLVWSNRSYLGEALDEEEFQTLTDLYGYAQDLSGSVQAMAGDLGSLYDWRSIRQDGAKLLEEDTLVSKYQSLRGLQKPFEEYPDLVYEGPYSDHMSHIEPRGLSGEEISQEEGRALVEKLYAPRSGHVEFLGENDLEQIPTFSYRVQFEEEQVAFVDVTRQGGALCSVLFQRPSGDLNLDPEQAVAAGQSFLQSIGLRDMQDTYYQVEGDSVTISYVYMANDTLYYPDLVKVKIALDNGEMVGYEAHGYLNCHYDRPAIEPGISLDEAREVISPHLDILAEGIAVIPNGHGGEVAVYEFHCRAMGRDFLVYVNQANGREEDVLVLLDEEGGTLTL